MLLGGSSNEGSVSRKVLVFRNNEWSSQVIPKMIESRENGSAVGSGIYLLALGGSKSSKKSFPTIEVYSSDSKRWLKVGNLQRADNAMQCFTHNDYLYIGYLDSFILQYCSIHDLVHSKKLCWKNVQGDLYHSCSGVFVYDNTLVALSATTSGSGSEVFAYDPTRERWKIVNCVGSLPTTEKARCCLISPEKILVCGDVSDVLSPFVLFVLSIN